MDDFGERWDNIEAGATASPESRYPSDRMRIEMERMDETMFAASAAEVLITGSDHEDGLHNDVLNLKLGIRYVAES